MVRARWAESAGAVGSWLGLAEDCGSSPEWMPFIHLPGGWTVAPSSLLPSPPSDWCQLHVCFPQAHYLCSPGWVVPWGEGAFFFFLILNKSDDSEGTVFYLRLPFEN